MLSPALSASPHSLIFLDYSFQEHKVNRQHSSNNV
jgi:hypothetical protein